MVVDGLPDRRRRKPDSETAYREEACARKEDRSATRRERDDVKYDFGECTCGKTRRDVDHAITCPVFFEIVMNLHSIGEFLEPRRRKRRAEGSEKT
jgi:hypothetical protein